MERLALEETGRWSPFQIRRYSQRLYQKMQMTPIHESEGLQALYLMRYSEAIQKNPRSACLVSMYLCISYPNYLYIIFSNDSSGAPRRKKPKVWGRRRYGDTAIQPKRYRDSCSIQRSKSKRYKIGETQTRDTFSNRLQ